MLLSAMTRFGTPIPILRWELEADCQCLLLNDVLGSSDAGPIRFDAALDFGSRCHLKLYRWNLHMSFA